MTLDFDLTSVRTTEFGVGLDQGDRETFASIPVDRGVQKALQGMAIATLHAMPEPASDLPRYDPSEKYAGTECLQLPLGDPLAKRLRDLHEASILVLDATALEDPSRVFAYFARMTDARGRRLTALRRATQFKGVLKSRLVRFVTNALQIVPDKVFKLDSDFDLLVDTNVVYILRPSGFEFTSQLQEAILAAVPANIKILQRDLTFVDFDAVERYASNHPRAARYLASIRSQKETKNVDRASLRRLCKATGVEVVVVGGKMTVRDDEVIAFLEVLDRRRYELELVRGVLERYKAASRSKIEK